MKYYYQLSEVEQAVIRLKSFYSTFRVISNGVEHSTTEDVQEAMFYLEGSLEDIQRSLDDSFYKLWEDVRDGSSVEELNNALTDEQSEEVWNHVVENLQINPNNSEEKT
jgi:hypothetical protein